MATTSRIQAVRAALHAQLDARGGLSGVQVAKYKISPDDADWDEGIALGKATAQQETNSYTGDRDETVVLDVIIWCRKDGDGDDVAEAAETRVLALWAEVEAQVRGDITVNSTVSKAEIGDYEIDVTAGDGCRIAALEGNVDCLSEI